MLNGIWTDTEVGIQSSVPHLIEQCLGILRKLQVEFYKQVSGALKQIIGSCVCIVRVFFLTWAT